MNNDAFSAESKVVVFDRSRSKHLEVQPMDFVLALEENVLAQNLRSITATLNFIKGLFLLMETGLRKECLFLLGLIFYRRC